MDAWVSSFHFIRSHPGIGSGHSNVLSVFVIDYLIGGSDVDLRITKNQVDAIVPVDSFLVDNVFKIPAYQNVGLCDSCECNMQAIGVQ